MLSKTSGVYVYLLCGFMQKLLSPLFLVVNMIMKTVSGYVLFGKQDCFLFVLQINTNSSRFFYRKHILVWARYLHVQYWSSLYSSYYIARLNTINRTHISVLLASAKSPSFLCLGILIVVFLLPCYIVTSLVCFPAQSCLCYFWSYYFFILSNQTPLVSPSNSPISYQ